MTNRGRREYNSMIPLSRRNTRPTNLLSYSSPNPDIQRVLAMSPARAETSRQRATAHLPRVSSVSRPGQRDDTSPAAAHTTQTRRRSKSSAPRKKMHASPPGLVAAAYIFLQGALPSNPHGGGSRGAEEFYPCCSG